MHIIIDFTCIWLLYETPRNIFHQDQICMLSLPNSSHTGD